MMMKVEDYFSNDFYELEYLDDYMESAIVQIFIPISYDLLRSVGSPSNDITKNVIKRILDPMSESLKIQSPINPLVLRNSIKENASLLVGYALSAHKSDKIIEKCESYKDTIENTVNTIDEYYNLNK